MMGKSWNTLSRDDQVRLELKASVDPIFFCENEYFLGEKLYRTPKGTSQYDIIKEFFKKTPKGESVYNELVLSVGMRASKTYLSSLITTYELFQLLLFEDPAAHFGLSRGSEIFLINAATNDDQAKDTIFAQTKAKIDNSPWFQAQSYKERTNEFKFDNKSVVVRSGGSNSDALIGKTAKLVLFDELDSFLSTQGKRSGQMVYSRLGKSVRSFGHEGKKVSLSSPLTSDGVIMSLAKMYSGARISKDFEYGIYTKQQKMVVYLPTWKMNPTLTYEVLWNEDGQFDPGTFWRDFGAKPTYGTDLFYKDPTAIKFSDKPNLAVHFCDFPDNAKVFNWDWKPDEAHDYKIAGDPAQKEDAFAFAIGHVEDEKPIVDALFRLVPENKIELKPSEVKAVVVGLHEIFGFNEMVIDQNRYPEITEEMEQVGVDVILHQADYTTYRFMKSRLLGGILQIPHDDVLLKELTQLKDIKGTRVDHPDVKGGSKDMADAVANLSWLLIDSKNLKKNENRKSQMQFITGVSPWK